MIVDANAVIAAIFREQNRHDECVLALTEANERILSPLVLAEIDYFILEYGDVEIELAFLAEVAAGVYTLASFSERDIATAHTVIQQYRSLGIGLAMLRSSFLRSATARATSSRSMKDTSEPCGR